MEAPSAIPEGIRTLVQSFEFHEAAYKRGQFNETQLRREFIDPFFKALGWDIDNNQRYSELYKDVIHEDPIRIRGSTEFIDYSFRIGGMRKFIVEAKKPGVNIKDDANPALQIRRYAWNARLPLAVLTDFEEFAVYDCTKKPMPGDTAATARVAYFTFKDYPEKWSWIASIFAKESVLQGSFDHFAQQTKGKKGTATVDEAILADIEEWRDALAKNLALRNPALTVDELNVAVQRTIDRILFLRICEDRGIEEYGCLQKLLDGQDVYQRLLAMFRRADTRYNSGIFHFSPEAGRDEMPDSLTPGLSIDDAVLKKIIKRLYYPESPYEFSVISPVILGQVYEQFLGKGIRLTPGHQAKVEYKPEVKKAGGVYYTPQYIVDYIVKETVGELVKDKTPREVASLRVLDPACGSGSFLLGAYQFLLDWHLEYYIHNLVPVLAGKPTTAPEVRMFLPEPILKTGKKKSVGNGDLPIYKSANQVASRTRSDWKLTTAERKRILLNNIYGVDIDTQAVEVTKLSLLLKVLEEENEENVSKQLKLFDERVLPSLHENIKCGNSLIGSDILTTRPLSPEEIGRINPFDWDREFPLIMAAGGFDAVIGNPPYVWHEFLLSIKVYLKGHYHTFHGLADLYVYFIERGVNLLKEGGIFSYIIGNKWLRSNYGTPLRVWLKSQNLEEIVDFGDLPVFKKATSYPCILRISKKRVNSEFKCVRVNSLTFLSLEDYVSENQYPVQKIALDDSGWTLANEKTQALLKKLKENSVALNEYVQGEIFLGILTGLDKVFIINKAIYEKIIAEDPKSREVIKPFLMGRDIQRYQPPPSGRYVIFMPKGWTDRKAGRLSNPLKWMKSNYPGVMEYLLPFSEAAGARDASNKGDYWWELRTCQYLDQFEKQKIMYNVFQVRPLFTLDTEGYLANHAVWFIPKPDKYLLGILNSKIGWLLISNYCTQIQNGYQLIFKYLGKISIRPIDSSNPDDVAKHDQMVNLVERMLALHEQQADVKTDHEKNLVERQIEATDKQIDTLVYKLYGLTDDEIRIVEGKGT
ncbi:MAG: DNA methyltransferase [Methanospirillum sp.]